MGVKHSVVIGTADIKSLYEKVVTSRKSFQQSEYYKTSIHQAHREKKYQLFYCLTISLHQKSIYSSLLHRKNCRDQQYNQKRRTSTTDSGFQNGCTNTFVSKFSTLLMERVGYGSSHITTTRFRFLVEPLAHFYTLDRHGPLHLIGKSCQFFHCTTRPAK